ncbi:MAG: beta-aspartyl-peptidase [Thermoanaerobacteraceae bacterium]|nr:beta-aspartyl-peptidase [Thermoanaerobacteraceae bacterium]
MHLELREITVNNLEYSERTEVRGKTLFINKEEILEELKMDEAIEDVDIDIAKPGQKVRIIPVKDVIEPRCKISGPGNVFPGFIGGMETVGSGVSLALKGVAVVTCGPIVAFQEGFIDMCGVGSRFTPFSKTNNVALLLKVKPSLTPVQHEEIVRKTGLKLAYYLAEKSKNAQEYKTSIFDLPSPRKIQNNFSNLPSFVYVYLNISQGLLHDTYVYGKDLKTMFPVILHPNEILDGAIVSGNCVSAGSKNTTFHHLNNPVIKELYARNGKDLNFVGVVIGTELDTLSGKIRSSEMVREYVKMLGADVAIISEEGAGNPDTDLCLCCKALEKSGIKTVVIANECAGEDGKTPGLADTTPEMDAFVSTGNSCEIVVVPPMEKIIGCHESIAVLAGGYADSLQDDGSIKCQMMSIVGSVNETGFLPLGCKWV